MPIQSGATIAWTKGTTMTTGLLALGCSRSLLRLPLRCHEDGRHLVDGDRFANAAAEAEDEEPRGLKSRARLYS